MLLAAVALGQPPAPSGMKERTNLRNTAYCELLPRYPPWHVRHRRRLQHPRPQRLPQAKWQALDPDRLKKEFHVYAVVKNGPRYFMMDRNALKDPGGVQSFDGLDARLLAQVEMSSANRKPAYAENTVDRETRYIYNAGTKVYELVSP